MSDGVHIRLMVSRGTKSTPYQDPRVTIGPPTIVIIPEYKRSEPAPRGLALYTVHVRRGYADVQDPTLNTHSKLNCIAACIQAAKAGADEALMLRSTRLCRDLQQHTFLCCPAWRNLDLERRLLSRRYNPRCRHRARRAERANGSPEEFHAGRRLQCRRGVRHGYFCRAHTGRQCRRPYYRDWRSARHADVARALRGLARRRGRCRARMTAPVRVAMWSGPRNISTAMMRSFEARGDCAGGR